VLPFVFACTFIADTASMLLPVSNPINILILHSIGGGLGSFLRYLLLPALAAVTLNTLVFVLLFRRDLAQDYRLQDAPRPRPADARYLAAVSIVLGAIAGGYVAASILRVPLSFVALGGAAVLLGVASWRRRLDPRTIARKVSWSLFPFVGGMFILVRAVENLGFTAEAGRLLVGAAGGSALAAVVLVTVGTALGANLINNVPMALVMVSTLGGLPAATPALASLPYAAMFGADLGPNLTTVGSLATMLWLLILRRRGLEVSTLQYFRLGMAFVPVLLLAGSVLIWLRL